MSAEAPHPGWISQIHYLGYEAPPDSEAAFGFFQSATISPDGREIAWVDANTVGGTGQLRVSIDPYHGIGPDTISNVYPPQWSADSCSVVVRYDGEKTGRIDVYTGMLTPITSAGECCFGVFSPDGGFAILHDGVNYSVVHADGCCPGPALAPPGEIFSRIQSLSPDGRHVIALLRPAGSPDAGAGRVFDANTIVDSRTGTAVPVPDGGTLRGGFYQPNGNIVLRMFLPDPSGGKDRDVVRVFSAAGALISERVVDPMLRSIPLVNIRDLP